MKLSGTKTEVSQVSIDVDPISVLDQMKRQVFPLLEKGYVTKDFWYAYVYTHPHSGEDYYEVEREVSENEREILNAFNLLKDSFERLSGFG